MISPDLLAISRGDAPADLLFTNARLVNVFTREIESSNLAVHAATGRIAGIGDYSRAAHTIDLKNSFLAPGFIDAHMHVESTMLPPSEFVKLALPHGTTAAVFDPHEIANVLGLDGIRYIMDDARDLPFNSLFALPSCVPASHLETSGAKLEAADLEPLFDDPRVVALAEMMNFPGVITARPSVLAKVDLGLRKGLVDGHAPGLRGKNLNAYLAAGISSDHECTTPDEALEKLRRGMHIYIREGSAARNLEALLPIVTPANAHRFSFCTDDRHPADLKHEGHIDHVVRRAISLGLDPATAVAMASLHTAQHYRQRDLGAIAPGRFADLIVFDDLNKPTPRQVYFRGNLVAENETCLRDPFGASTRSSGAGVPPAATPSTSSGPNQALRWCGSPTRCPDSVRIPLRLPPNLSELSFRIPATGAKSLRVIGMFPDQLVTDSLVLPANPVNGEHRADPARDLLKLAVIERHRATGNIGLGFAKGFKFKHGALASTVGHDSHNLAIVGASDSDMLTAARALAAAGGGQCAVLHGKVLALLPLPIAGLMSDQSADTVIEQQRQLLDATKAMGCPHADPFMPLSFLPLPVIPRLKLTDLGLVDVERFEIVPLEL